VDLTLYELPLGAPDMPTGYDEMTESGRGRLCGGSPDARGTPTFAPEAMTAEGSKSSRGMVAFDYRDWHYPVLVPLHG
jgi:hypothetical protein